MLTREPRLVSWRAKHNANIHVMSVLPLPVPEKWRIIIIRFLWVVVVDTALLQPVCTAA